MTNRERIQEAIDDLGDLATFLASVESIMRDALDRYKMIQKNLVDALDHCKERKERRNG